MSRPNSRSPVPLVFGLSFGLTVFAVPFTFSVVDTSTLNSDVLSILLLISVGLIGLLSMVVIHIITGILGLYYEYKRRHFERVAMQHRQHTLALLMNYQSVPVPDSTYPPGGNSPPR